MIYRVQLQYLIILFRSNLVGTKFTVYDNGVNPNKGGVLSDGSNIRQELCTIVYVSVCFLSISLIPPPPIPQSFVQLYM